MTSDPGVATARSQAIRRRLAIASVLGAMTLAVLDASIVNVALPSLAQALGIAASQSVAVVTAYQLGLVMLLLPAAALGEAFAFRRTLLSGIALFTGASLLCALAPSFEWLILARFLQGCGSAAIMALGIATLRAVVTQEQFGSAIGWNALTVALSSAAGPGLGAIILSFAPWQWLFAINLPIGIAVFVVAFWSLPTASGSGRLPDALSALTSAGAFALLVLGAEWIPTAPCLASFTLAGSGAAMAFLVRRELSRSVPLVPLDLLADRSFRLSVVASVLFFIGTSAGAISLPFLLQGPLHKSASETAALLVLWPLSVAIAGPVAGKLAKRVATDWLCLAGGLTLTSGLALAALSMSRPDPLLVIAGTVACGVGFGLFNVPNNRNMFLFAPASRSGAAGGMQGIARLTGQTVGALLIGLVFQSRVADGSLVTGLAVAASFTLAAALISGVRLVAPGVATGHLRQGIHRSSRYR